jgi:hypothetical protein
MDGLELSFDGKRVSVGAQEWEVEYLIQDAIIIDGKVLVLYDPDARPNRYGQFRNLVAFNLKGEKIWTAEHPTNGTADVYIEIVKKEPFTVWNFACYNCTINPANGKLVEAIFTK